MILRPDVVGDVEPLAGEGEVGQHEVPKGVVREHVAIARLAPHEVHVVLHHGEEPRIEGLRGEPELRGVALAHAEDGQAQRLRLLARLAPEVMVARVLCPAADALDQGQGEGRRAAPVDALHLPLAEVHALRPHTDGARILRGAEQRPGALG